MQYKPAPSCVTTQSKPRIWVLVGRKAGDNTQVTALADALGWPCEVKRLAHRKTELLSNLLLGKTLYGIVRRRSSSLEPPWPDLVITAGRRNEPVARWIRKQSRQPVRLVHVGRPWASPDRFDLIVTTPQYLLPERPNILHNALPLHDIDRGQLSRAAGEWAPELAHLPRPFITVLLGGDSGPFAFDIPKAVYLAAELNRMARGSGGTLLVTSSARTPARTYAAFAAGIDVPAFLFPWNPGAKRNPYRGFLALADSIVVTGESMSMLTEACATCKPVYIFDLGDHSDRGGRAFRSSPWQRLRNSLRFKALTHRLAMRLGPRRMMRDVRLIQEQLVASGRAVRVGDVFPSERHPAPPDDLQRAVDRVKALFKASTQP